LPPKTKYGKPALHHRTIWDPCFDRSQGWHVQLEETDEERAKRKEKENSAAISGCFSKSAAAHSQPAAQVTKPVRSENKNNVKKGPCKVVNKPVAKPVTDVVNEDDIYNNVDSSPVTKKEVFVSKYFGKGDPPAQKRAVVDDDVTFSPEPKRLKLSADQHSTPKAKVMQQKDWFDALDDKETADRRSLVYDVTTPKQVDKPFKPPAMKSPNKEKADEIVRKRNPFAKKLQSPPKTEVSPLKISASQVSTKSLTSENEYDLPSSPELARPLPVVESPPPSKCTNPPLSKLSLPTTKLFSSQLKTLSDVSNSASSGYFAPKPGTAKVSGLLKRNNKAGKSSKGQQPSILSMFKKV